MNDELRDQLQLFTIDSPCIGVCEVNNRGYCKGCFRSRDERFYWQQLSDGDKSKVLMLCQRRRKRIERDKAKKEQQVLPKGANLSLFDK
ncbi:DUF1289 domain-containing protein [Psychrobium sp. 1_MG-2023]|uniref:DUF1289 domain-containing protein n=1 Tax=Psychrobium sp. 1_MG-2023 TaxID=3062624 RepID=UPI000C322E3A|nr:DUF1289 domain-containing protein [Psychrobium sp. 1_MG-2023]MDP2560215.1 DUF1289 domain-containing protein [Psychrobium sp. 1_MG-2023]PKF57026.1 DUF1289 domain-containing protein [Alteromonadales bacterium alter-6D02]